MVTRVATNVVVQYLDNISNPMLREENCVRLVPLTVNTCNLLVNEYPNGKFCKVLMNIQVFVVTLMAISTVFT